jgi:hypothetical protein
LIVALLHVRGIAETLIEHYSCVMTVGCPTHFNATTTRDYVLLLSQGQPPLHPCKTQSGADHNEQR